MIIVRSFKVKSRSVWLVFGRGMVLKRAKMRTNRCGLVGGRCSVYLVSVCDFNERVARKDTLFEAISFNDGDIEDALCGKR